MAKARIVESKKQKYMRNSITIVATTESKDVQEEFYMELKKTVRKLREYADGSIDIRIVVTYPGNKTLEV